MVEGFSLVSELSTQIAHPVNVMLTVFNVECIWVVSLAQRLPLFKSLQDLIHWHLGFEFLVRGTNALDDAKAVLVKFSGHIALLGSQHSAGNIAEAAAHLAISIVGIPHIWQIVHFVLTLALEAV